MRLMLVKVVTACVIQLNWHTLAVKPVSSCRAGNIMRVQNDDIVCLLFSILECRDGFPTKCGEFYYDSACTKNVVQDGRKQQDEYMTGLRPCPAAFLMLHHIFRAAFHSKWITGLPDSPFFCECAIAQKLVQHRA